MTKWHSNESMPGAVSAIRPCFCEPMRSASGLVTYQVRRVCACLPLAAKDIATVSLSQQRYFSEAICVEEGPGLERPFIIEILRPMLNLFPNEKVTIHEEFLSRY